MLSDADSGKFIRQLGIYNPLQHQNAKAVVVGAGGLGSFSVLALAKMGVQEIEVWDDDVVSEHNQPNQLYGKKDLGQNKVAALSYLTRRLAGLHITTHYARVDALSREAFLFSINPFTVVILAADGMESRRFVWEAVKESTGMALIDTRMGGEYIEMFCVDWRKREHVEEYAKHLPEDKDVPELPCTARSTIYAGFAMGAWVAGAFKSLQSQQSVPFNMAMDFASFTFIRKRL
jgi:molybdopterin/thiamine biosynthesis adenylyltransferase